DGDRPARPGSGDRRGGGPARGRGARRADRVAEPVRRAETGAAAEGRGRAGREARRVARDRRTAPRPAATRTPEAAARAPRRPQEGGAEAAAVRPDADGGRRRPVLAGAISQTGARAGGGAAVEVAGPRPRAVVHAVRRRPRVGVVGSTGQAPRRGRGEA